MRRALRQFGAAQHRRERPAGAAARTGGDLVAYPALLRGQRIVGKFGQTAHRRLLAFCYCIRNTNITAAFDYVGRAPEARIIVRSEENTSELQSLMHS